MTLTEVAELLMLAAGADGRTVDQADVTAWHEVLHDLRFEDARGAVAHHYRLSTRRLMPADVRSYAKAVRERRIARELPAAPPDPDDVAGYQRALAETVRRTADGMALPRPELPPSPPTEAFKARPRRDEQKIAALRVRCPWCNALPGERCVIKHTGRRMEDTHPARQDAARERELS